MRNTDLRKRAPLSVVVAAALGLSGPAMAQMQTDNPGGPTGDLPVPTGAGFVLFDQTDNASGNGAPDQDFEAAYDVYDAEGADDFVVPGGTAWEIQQVSTPGTQSAGGAANSVDITFYTDDGGAPGAPVAACTYSELATVEDAGSHTITLPTPCTLSSGTYWMAQQTNQDFATDGQHFWSDRTVGNGNEAVWRSPGDGFGNGCTEFTPKTVCGVGDAASPDFLFALTGLEVDPPEPPPATAVPTMNRWGLSALILALLGFSGWVLMRRRQDAA